MLGVSFSAFFVLSVCEVKRIFVDVCGRDFFRAERSTIVFSSVCVSFCVGDAVCGVLCGVFASFASSPLLFFSFAGVYVHAFFRRAPCVFCAVGCVSSASGVSVLSFSLLLYSCADSA